MTPPSDYQVSIVFSSLIGVVFILGFWISAFRIRLEKRKQTRYTQQETI